MISKFGVSSDRSNWGIAGWSSGGTCALTLTVTHPELFSAFVDIDTPTVYRPAIDDPVPVSEPDLGGNYENHAVIADHLCRLASGHGIECAVVGNPGNHDFPSAGSAASSTPPTRNAPSRSAPTCTPPDSTS